MKTINHILLPVDYSDRSIIATQHARLLAERFGAKVTVLHVKEWPHGTEDPSVEVGAALMHEQMQGLGAEFVELIGHPAEVIVKCAQENGVDLIVMPTRGRGALRRFLLGSVTAKVLHDVEVPVWTGAHEQPETALPALEGIRNVACAVDLAPTSEGVLRWAGEFAAAFGAKLTAIHASPQLVPALGVVHDLEWRAHLSEVLNAALAETVQKAGVKAEMHLASGEAGKAVDEMAEALKADVLVIGRTPAGLMGRLRTTAYAIIRQSRCPVISV